MHTANGWPVLAKGSPLLHDWVIPNTGRKPVVLRVHNGSVGAVLAHNALWFDEVVERLDLSGPRDDWGYAERPIGGTNVITNHASGTAEDLNATRHPRGVAIHHTMTDRQIRLIRQHLTLMYTAPGKTILDWGGFWPSHPGSRALTDGMHFEITTDVTMAEVEIVARRLVRQKNPRMMRVLAANPGQEKVIAA